MPWTSAGVAPARSSSSSRGAMFLTSFSLRRRSRVRRPSHPWCTGRDCSRCEDRGEQRALRSTRSPRRWKWTLNRRGRSPRPRLAELRRDPEPGLSWAALALLGLTPQRPVRRAIEQVPAKVREWLTVDYPAIQAKARKAGAQIFFADEAGVRSNSHHSGTTWAPMGQTPVVPATGKRFGLNLVSAVSPQGVLRFMVVDGRMTAVRFIAFLKRLLHNQTRPIFLIVDQHSSHRAKAVQEFVASTDGHLERSSCRRTPRNSIRMNSCGTI